MLLIDIPDPTFKASPLSKFYKRSLFFGDLKLNESETKI